MTLTWPASLSENPFKLSSIGTYLKAGGLRVCQHSATRVSVLHAGFARGQKWGSPHQTL